MLTILYTRSLSFYASLLTRRWRFAETQWWIRAFGPSWDLQRPRGQLYRVMHVYHESIWTSHSRYDSNCISSCFALYSWYMSSPNCYALVSPTSVRLTRSSKRTYRNIHLLCDRTRAHRFVEQILPLRNQALRHLTIQKRTHRAPRRRRQSSNTENNTS